MAASSEIYSWNPVYGKKGSSPGSGLESNAVRVQSGLKHQVSVRATELQEPQREEVKERSQKEIEQDRKLISKVANSSLYTSMARFGDLVCILVLVVVLVLVVFFGIFFTYFFTK